MEVNRPESKPESITPLEIRILELLATGISNKEIEKQIKHAPGWLSAYLSSKVYKKLGVNNRYDAVMEAQTRGIIDQPISIQEALEIGRQASKILLYQASITAEELVTITSYRTLIPYMAEQISSPDKQRSLAGLAFTVRAQGQIFAELNQRVQALSPQIYGRIGLAAEAVSDKLIILGTKYEAEFTQTTKES